MWDHLDPRVAFIAAVPQPVGVPVDFSSIYATIMTQQQPAAPGWYFHPPPPPPYPSAVAGVTSVQAPAAPPLRQSPPQQQRFYGLHPPGIGQNFRQSVSRPPTNKGSEERRKRKQAMHNALRCMCNQGGCREISRRRYEVLGGGRCANVGRNDVLEVAFAGLGMEPDGKPHRFLQVDHFAPEDRRFIFEHGRPRPLRFRTGSTLADMGEIIVPSQSLDDRRRELEMLEAIRERLPEGEFGAVRDRVTGAADEAIALDELEGLYAACSADIQAGDVEPAASPLTGGDGNNLPEDNEAASKEWRRGKCGRHSAFKPKCTAAGCTNYPVRGGVCTRHGARKTKKICSNRGCKKEALRRQDVCREHGAKVKICRVKDCAKQAIYAGGVCRRHESAWKCGTKGCNYQALSVGIGFCKRHIAGKVKKRRSAGCTDNAVGRGTCRSDHGAGVAGNGRKRDRRRADLPKSDPELEVIPTKRRRRTEKIGQESETEPHAPTSRRRPRGQEIPIKNVEHTPTRRSKRMVDTGSKSNAADRDAPTICGECCSPKEHTARSERLRQKVDSASESKANDRAVLMICCECRSRKPTPEVTLPLRRRARVRSPEAAATAKNSGESTSDEFCDDQDSGGSDVPELALDRFVPAPSSSTTIYPELSEFSSSRRGSVSRRAGGRSYDSEEEEELGALIYQSSLAAKSITGQSSSCEGAATRPR